MFFFNNNTKLFLIFILQNLIDALENESSKKESCFAVNFLFQFLFKELRNTQKVQKWFRKKLSLEFEELLTRTTTGKLFDKVYVSYKLIILKKTIKS